MSSKTIIYLVRHGQTEWNVEHKMQGHQNSPLTDLGVKQAEWLGESIQDEPIDIIYSSSSPRAHKTAELIRGNRDIEIIDTDDFKEISLGIWEGKSQEEVKGNCPEQFHYFWNDPENFHVQGSESFRDVFNRAIRYVQQIINNHEGHSILIVTHTVVVKLIMSYFEGRAMKDIWNPPYIHPACLCKIAIEKNAADILLHGDTKHYKENLL